MYPPYSEKSEYGFSYSSLSASLSFCVAINCHTADGGAWSTTHLPSHFTTADDFAHCTRPELRRRSEWWTIRSPSVYPETIHQPFRAKQKSRYTHITTTSQTQQLFLMSQDLFDCYVSVTALNLRYHSADKITTDRLSKNARHNIYATLYRVANARTLVLLCFLF